tara:strand:- start:3476 stop:4483 length:1008 start_codon:yes stop_codon:yes gene_type:complete
MYLLYSVVIQVIVYIFFIFFQKRLLIKNYDAIQKIHEGNIPRIGGLMFLINLIILFYINNLNFIVPLLSGIFFIFVFSFYEDIKQNLSPLFRLVILSVGSLFFLIFTELPNIQISFLNIANEYYFFSIILFMLSLMLLMNGFNFIDGLNGLSSFNFFSILLSAYYIANFYDDLLLTNLISIIFISSLIVFFFNFPLGKVFLGDSGSYIYALISGAIIIYLFDRHEELPTMFSMVILAYPITEMLFSIFRKTIKGFSPLKPDKRHLHHLIFNRITGSKLFRNNLASLTMLPICFLPFLLSYLSINYYLHNNFIKFLIFFIIYSFAYIFFNKFKSTN